MLVDWYYKYIERIFIIGLVDNMDLKGLKEVKDRFLDIRSGK